MDCFFCGNKKGSGHMRECVYVTACELLDEETK